MLEMRIACQSVAKRVRARATVESGLAQRQCACAPKKCHRSLGWERNADPAVLGWVGIKGLCRTSRLARLMLDQSSPAMGRTDTPLLQAFMGLVISVPRVTRTGNAPLHLFSSCIFFLLLKRYSLSPRGYLGGFFSWALRYRASALWRWKRRSKRATGSARSGETEPARQLQSRLGSQQDNERRERYAEQLEIYVGAHSSAAGCRGTTGRSPERSRAAKR